MPNGYESPLNKLADALPGFIMQMQDMKLRQEAQEALNSYRMTMLNRQIAVETAERETKEALEDVRREMGYYEPPEVKVLRDNISYEMRTLNDPDISLTLDDEDIAKRWKKLQNMQADYFGRTGRDISVSMPTTVEGALGRIEAAKPPPAAAPAARPTGEVTKRRGGREIRPEVGGPVLAIPKEEPPFGEEIAARRAGIEALAPPSGVTSAFTPVEAPVVEEIPPGFPDPSGFPEGQTATFNGEPWIISNGQWVKGK